jgi:hypothetical protein
MDLLPLYLRREPAPGEPGRFEVVIYRDEQMTVRAGRWLWWSSQKPRRGCKTITFNCFNWRAVWVPDAHSPRRPITPRGKDASPQAAN